jgi:hypothetical protein
LRRAQWALALACLACTRTGPNVGLVTLEWDGRDGPSQERYSLVAIDPLPAK